MDLGLFRRRRHVFWLWIVCPAIAVVGIHYAIFSYNRHVSESLQELRAMAELLPYMEESLAESELEIDRFDSIRITAAQAQASLNTRISNIASRNGFELSNLRINSLPPAGPIHMLEIEVAGKGGILYIMKFTNELQSPESLMSLVECTLRVGTFTPIAIYNCSLSFEAGFAPGMRMGMNAGGNL